MSTSIDLRVLSECFEPTCEEGDEGIVGLSYQYKDDNGATVQLSRGGDDAGDEDGEYDDEYDDGVGRLRQSERCKTTVCSSGVVMITLESQARLTSACQVQLRLSLACNPNISVKVKTRRVFKTGRLQIAGCKDEGTCNKIVRHVLNCLNSIQASPQGARVFERHVCEPSGEFEQGRAKQSRAEQSRAEQGKAEQSRAEQSRAEQSRAEQRQERQERNEGWKEE
eukprot:752712-Hanusia_phi.AAC.4